MKRLYSEAVVVGCQAPEGQKCQGKCRKHFAQCKPVWDAEAFCRYHLDRAFKKFPNGEMFLRGEEHEDSVSLLIFHLIRMEKTFDHERNDSFENFAKTYLPKRAVDVGPRRVLGRNGNKLHNYLFEELDETAKGTGHVSFEPEGGGNPSLGRGDDARGLQSERDRRTIRALRFLGKHSSNIAA